METVAGSGMDQSVFDRIQAEIDAHDVVLFMKGTPIFPQCSFSAQAVQILGILGVSFKSLDVLTDPRLRQGIRDFSNWPTIPQLYIKGRFVGGADIMREMLKSGELPQLLEELNVPYALNT